MQVSKNLALGFLPRHGRTDVISQRRFVVLESALALFAVVVDVEVRGLSEKVLTLGQYTGFFVVSMAAEGRQVSDTRQCN